MNNYALTKGGKRAAVLFVLIAMLLAFMAPGVVTANGDQPTVAFLRFGSHPVLDLVDKAVLDLLQEYGFVDDAERESLEGGHDLHGAHINLLNREAGFDFTAASLMVEDALDEGADVLLTVSNEVGILAANAMRDLDDPPALIFAIVTAPEITGIVQSACVKPDNVTGTQMYFDQALFDRLMFIQDPHMDSFGILVDTSDPASSWYEMESKKFAEEHGLRLEIAAGASAADWQVGTQSLVDKDVDAIFLLPRTSDPARGISAVITEAIGVPVFSLIATDVFEGVTIAAGFQGWYNEGLVAARMVIGHLRGEMDIATTGVSSSQAVAVAVNLDSAALQEVDISDEMLMLADFVIEGGAGMGTELEIPGVNTVLEEMTLEERMASDQAFLGTLHCTPEMIAEQQAALDAQA